MSVLDTVHKLLQLVLTRRASDLFLTVGFPPAMKIDGAVTPVNNQVLTPKQVRDLCQSIMTDSQWLQFQNNQEANFAIAPEGVGRFRVNAFVQQGNMGVVIRTIAQHIPQLEKLNLPPVLKDITMAKRGLVLFVGGTGSGKSTSLAAMINHRNENAQDHIITIEDPIEYVHLHKKSIITQREVGIDTQDWFSALKNTLRQAPNVILIGEIRERETMEYALNFAETGHLVFSTLHANSSNQALGRIVNFFPQEAHKQLFADLALNVRAIVSQRLIPHKSGTNRVAAVEVLLNTPLVADLMVKGKIDEIKAIMHKSRESGMQTFDHSLFDLHEAGLISIEEALSNADSATDLRLHLKLDSKTALDKDIMAGTHKMNIV